MSNPLDATSKLNAPLKKSIFERQKEEAEAKRAKEQAETAAVLEDFVKSFEDDGSRPLSTLSRSGPPGPGKRHFTGSGLRSGPGSLGPSLAHKSGPGSLGPTFARKRAYDEHNDRKDPGGYLSYNENRRESLGEDQDAEEKAAAARPTIHLSQLPPNTSPATVKGLFASSSLVIQHVRLLPSVAGTSTSERRSMSAIVTLAADTPGADIDAMVSRLQNKYLGVGFNLSISRGLSSSAALSGTAMSTGGSHDLPFGARTTPRQGSLARAPPPGHRFAPPASYTSSAPYGRHTTHVAVQAPSDLHQLKLIHKMLEALLTYGPEFEALLMSRPEVQQDEEWSWLWNARSAGGVYYRWRLWEILTDAKSRRKHNRYPPQLIFEGQSIWQPPEEPLRFEYTTQLDDFVHDEDYNSSDEEEDEGGIANRYNDHNATGGRIEEGHEGQGYLNPLARSKLVHLLARLPDTSAKLRRGDIARITAFAIKHAGAGAEEVAALITRNVVRPFCGGSEDDKTSASQVGLYAISDILSSSASAGVRHAWRYRTLFESALRQQRVWEILGRAERDHAWGKLKAEKWKRSIHSLFNLWEGWSVFPQASHEEFVNSFLNPPLADKERLLAEAEAKRKAEEEARRSKNVNRWRSVDDEPAASDDVKMTGVDGAAMNDDSDMDTENDENIDGVPMVDSSDEEAGDPMDTMVTDTTEADPIPRLEPEPEPDPAKPPEIKTEAQAPGRRQRPRAADMFADNSE